MSELQTLRPEVEVISPPERFSPWPDDVKQHAQDVWSTVGGRNCTTVHQLLQAESPDTAVPTASTICRWKDTEAWHIAADELLESTRDRTLRELKVGWLTAQQLALGTVLAGLQGLLDDLPYGGSARLKAAELVIRKMEKGGMLALLPDPLPPDPSTLAKLSSKEQSRQNRERIAEAKREHGRG